MAERISEEHAKRWWDPVLTRYANRGGQALDDTEGDQVRVNLLYSNTQTRMPYLFSRFPDIFTYPLRPDVHEDAPELARSLLMHFSKLNKVKAKVNRAILDGELQSMGCLKVGYSIRTWDNTAPPKNLIGKAVAGVKEFVGSMMGQTEAPEETSSVDDSLPVRIASEGPTLIHVSPRNILTHPDAKFPYDENAYWLCHKVTRPLSVVQNDNRFPSKWRRELESTAALDPAKYPGLPGTSLDNTDPDPSTLFVSLYEIWDRERREVLTYASENWDKGPGRVVDWPFDGMQGYPFIFYVPREVPEATRGLTAMDPIVNQLEEIDAIRTLQLRHLRRFSARRYIYNAALEDQDEIDKLRKDEDCAIPCDADGSVEGYIVPIPDAPLPGDVYAFEQRVKEDVDEVDGTSELRRGQSGGSQTATEASIIEEASKARSDSARDQVVEFLLEYFFKTFQICQQWLPQRLAVKIAGQLGEEWVDNVTPDMIEGQIDIEILPGSTAPLNMQMLRAEAMNLYTQVLLNNPGIDQQEAIRLILDKFPELLRGGRLKKLVKNPEAVQGPVQPESIDGTPAPPPASGPGGGADIEALMAEAQGGGGGQPMAL